MYGLFCIQVTAPYKHGLNANTCCVSINALISKTESQQHNEVFILV